MRKKLDLELDLFHIQVLEDSVWPTENTGNRDLHGLFTYGYSVFEVVYSVSISDEMGCRAIFSELN